MKFFLISLGIHIFITALFVMFTVITSNRNKKGLVKRGFWYFMPIILSILAVVHLVSFTLPRLLDIPSAIERDFKEVSGEISEVSDLSNYFVVNGVRYYYVDFDGKYPKNHDNVNIKYLKNSNCVVSIEVNDEED